MALKTALEISRSLRLPDGEFFPAARKKTGIALHHTVGGTAYSTLHHWLKDRTRAGKRRVVGTAYIIDRDGTVYQVFQPTAWAFQFGLNWPPAVQMKFEQRFIGIEIASEGGLTEFDGHLYCFDQVSPKTRKPRAESFDYGESYRGYRYFDEYEPGDTLGLEYFVAPAWFTETFLIDHDNAESWRKQKDKLLAVDSLRVQVATLQDSIARLHALNTFALQSGYDNAASEYRDLSSRYIAELRKPTLSIGSTVGVCLAAAGAGLGIGAVINR